MVHRSGLPSPLRSPAVLIHLYFANSRAWPSCVLAVRSPRPAPTFVDVEVLVNCHSVPLTSRAHRSGMPPEPPVCPAALPGTSRVVVSHCHVDVDLEGRTGLFSRPTPAGLNSHSRAGPPLGSVSTVIRLVLQATVGAAMSQPPRTGPIAATCTTLFQVDWSYPVQ